MANTDPSTGAVIRINRGTNAFDGLSPQARLRLMVTVLCELVAYGESMDAAVVAEGSFEPVSATQASEPFAASG